MSECTAVRRLLALRPADRSESERALVQVHLAGCPACAAVARAYAGQDWLPQAGSRVFLTPAQRRGLFGRLEQMRRGHRLRSRLSWVLGVPFGIVAVLAVVVATSYLLSSKTAPEGMGRPSPTATSSPLPSPSAVSLTVTPLPAFPTSSGPYVTVRFACYSFQQEAFSALAAEFQAQNPDVRIEFVTLEDVVGDDYTMSRLNLVSAADAAYFWIDAAAVSQGLLRDLTPFIAADESFAPEDFFPGTLAAFQWDDRTWALPSQVDMTFLIYDKPMFDAAGVPYPTLAWSRDDFLAAAQRLTLRRGQEVTQYGFVDYAAPWTQALILQAVGNYRQLGRELPLDDPAVVAAVSWYTDLALRHQVMPPLQFNQEGVDRRQYLIESGKAAMWSDGLLNYRSLYRDYFSRDVGLAPVPTADGPVVPGYMYGYFMSAGTEHPQESWRWLRFLSGQRLLLEDWPGDGLPARRSVAEHSGYWDQIDAETIDVVRYASEHLFFSPLSEANLPLAGAIYRIFGGQPVAAALAEAQETLAAQLAQAAQATPIPVVITTPQPAGPTGAIVVTFAPPGGQLGAEDYQALAAAFNQAYTDVQVQLLLPNQAEEADCFAGARSVDDAESRAGLLDLQPLLDADSTFALDDFYPRFLDALRYEGDLWGIPTQAQVRVIFYNRDLFDAAGVPYPQPGWSLEDFQSLAISLTQGTGEEKQYGFLPLNGDVSDLRTFLALQEAVLWDGEGRPRFDAPDVAVAVQWYADLALRHAVMPAFPDDLPDGGTPAWSARSALIRAGRVAMWTDFTGLDRRDVWPAGARVGLAPLPVYGARGVTEFLPQGLFIAAGSPHPQACWKWFRFISARPEIVQNVPARRSVADSPAFAERVGSEAGATFRATLMYAEVPLSFTPEQAAQLRWLYQALADILRGVPVEDALATAQREAMR